MEEYFRISTKDLGMEVLFTEYDLNKQNVMLYEPG